MCFLFFLSRRYRPHLIALFGLFVKKIQVPSICAFCSFCQEDTGPIYLRSFFFWDKKTYPGMSVAIFLQKNIRLLFLCYLFFSSKRFWSHLFALFVLLVKKIQAPSICAFCSFWEKPYTGMSVAFFSKKIPGSSFYSICSFCQKDTGSLNLCNLYRMYSQPVCPLLFNNIKSLLQTHPGLRVTSGDDTFSVNTKLLFSATVCFILCPAARAEMNMILNRIFSQLWTQL